MIEGGFILLVFAISGLIYLGARVGATRAQLSPHEQVAHLQERLAWHEGQLRLAREKKWDDVMIRHIMDQLSDTRQQLGQLQAGAAGGE